MTNTETNLKAEALRIWKDVEPPCAIRSTTLNEKIASLVYRQQEARDLVRVKWDELTAAIEAAAQMGVGTRAVTATFVRSWTVRDTTPLSKAVNATPNIQISFFYPSTAGEDLIATAEQGAL